MRRSLTDGRRAAAAGTTPTAKLEGFRLLRERDRSRRFPAGGCFFRDPAKYALRVAPAIVRPAVIRVLALQLRRRESLAVSRASPHRPQPAAPHVAQASHPDFR